MFLNQLPINYLFHLKKKEKKLTIYLLLQQNFNANYVLHFLFPTL